MPPAAVGFVSLDVTQSFQDWSNGALDYGLAIVNPGSDYLMFMSSDEPVLADRPLLTIDYTIPEPSTLAIWGTLGGLCLIVARRRRKRVA